MISPSLQRAIEYIVKGKMVIMIDSEHRENEGDLVVSAQLVTAEHINFMIKYGRGLVCLAMTDNDLQRLSIPMTHCWNHTVAHSPFATPIDAAFGITTGVSAADRAHTIRVVADQTTSAQHILMPGHVYPLRANPEGLKARHGHTEGSVTLMKMAQLQPLAVICEIIRDDGTMARWHDLQIFGEQYNLPIVTIADLIIADCS